MKNRTCKSMPMIYKCSYMKNRTCKSLGIDLQVRFYFTTALVNVFYPKNLKRATPVSHFHFLLHSGLRFHCSCARVFSASSFLFAIVSFANLFIGIGIFVPNQFSLALAFSFLTSFRWRIGILGYCSIGIAPSYLLFAGLSLLCHRFRRRRCRVPLPL